MAEVDEIVSQDKKTETIMAEVDEIVSQDKKTETITNEVRIPFELEEFGGRGKIREREGVERERVRNGRERQKETDLMCTYSRACRSCVFACSEGDFFGMYILSYRIRYRPH